ncbi:MAG: copper amine oxidase N-terminal domain-containing protein, partial [Moorellaceae bacterium]
MKKKWLVVTSTVMLTLAFATGAFAANPINLYVNGREIKPDVLPQIINGRTMVPVRWIAEALGANVEWEQDSEGGIVKITMEVLQRLRALEPEQPKTIASDFNSEQVKQFLEQNQLNFIQDIRSLGRKVPFEIVNEDDTWYRPVYSKYWHSTFMG